MITHEEPQARQARHGDERNGGAPRAAPDVEVVRAFAEIADTIGDDVDLDVMLHRIARRIAALVAIPRCSVYLLDRSTNSFHGRIGEPETEGDAEIRRLRTGTDADAFTQEIVSTKLPVVVHDTGRDPRPVRSAMRRWNVRSMLGVPLILRGEVIGVLYLDEPGTLRAFSAEVQQIAAAFATLAAMAIDQAARAGEMKSAVVALERKNDLLWRSTVVDERLTSLLVESRGLKDIAVAVAQLSGKPCVIWDAERRPLALQWPGGGEGAKAGFDAQLSASTDLEAALSVLQPGRPGLIGPFLPALPNRLLAAQIRVRDELWGFIALSECEGRLTPVDAAIMRRAAMVVAVELTAERRAMRGEADARQVLLRDLLRGAGADDAHLESRAELLGLRRGHLVCLVKRRAGAATLTRSEIMAVLGDGAPGWFPELTVSDDGTVVLLAEVPEGKAPSVAVAATKAALDRLVQDIGGAGDVLVAVSSVCGTLTGLGRAHDEALQVLSCLERLTGALPGSLALTSDDLGPARLLLGATDLAQAGRYASDALCGLFTGEDERPTEMLHTLDVFFAHQRNVHTTATLLEVHQNTVRYRLGRVAEITSLNVMGDPDDQMKVHIALMILRLTGRLPTRRSAAGHSHFISLN